MHKIVADENIPCVREAFSHLGEIRSLPGRVMRREALQDAELLLVRAVTPVNAGLLAGTLVRFVATATIGTDHVDLEYLQKRGIAFASAAGSNANAVAEYVIAALLHHLVRHNLSLTQLTLGIVGAGNIGSRVAKMAAGLGMKVLLNDPPLARQMRDEKFLPLDALMDADIVTLHTPLTFAGADATFHLFDAERLRKMKPGSVLINTCRGPVVDNAALKKNLQSRHLSAAILDVWENEPAIDPELLRLVEIGTPHIAGYSLDGKLNGTYQIYRAACEFLGVTPQWRIEDVLPSISEPVLAWQPEGGNDEASLQKIVQRAYDIMADDRRLRESLTMGGDERRSHFDRLRRDYAVRREFHNYALSLSTDALALSKQLAAIGFRLSPMPPVS
jgi:erythronate-4-phosphate dehydrogenase